MSLPRLPISPHRHKNQTLIIDRFQLFPKENKRRDPYQPPSSFGVVFVGAGPVVEYPFFGFTVVTDLKGEVGMGMAVIAVAAFVFLEDFDKDFFVVPGLGGEGGIGFVVALELKKFFIGFARGGLLIVLHDEAGDFLGGVFHSLDVEIDLRADLVF